MNTVAIIQARMGSTRLPGKVLQNLAGEPVLRRVINRVRRAETLTSIVIATTEQPADDAIVALCASIACPYFRGSEQDVLDRYYRAAHHYQADLVVRITSDCPLIEPAIIDQVVQALISAGQYDYVSNTLAQRTFPRGLDVEALTFAALERAWKDDPDPAWREHVTPYIYRHPELFRLHHITHPVDYSAMRWTVDTPEDLAFVRHIYDHFGHDRFSWHDVLHVLKQHPDWLDINRAIEQKQVP
jgi:spore coat polysaccharide biosynthesis protein SpsF